MVRDGVTREDYRWLVGDEAARWLDELAACSESLVRRTRRLRRSLSAARVHLLLQQVALRRRAAEKFSLAPRLFFTEKGLEQATDQWVARYKASRFPAGAAVADLCCGIGGDLMELARRGVVAGVDRDAATAILAEANVRRALDGRGTGAGAEGHWGDVRCVAAEAVDVRDYAAWHIDPDRRAGGRRELDPAAWSPPLETLRGLWERQPRAAVKLAPATPLPDFWRTHAEREWIECRGECRQQVAWLGPLARHPGRRVATVIDRARGTARTVVEADDEPSRPGGSIECAPRGVGRYVYEPASAVLAAGLTGTLARQWNLAAVAPRVDYLTGEEVIDDPALQGFEVLEQWPLDVRRLRAALAARDIGTLEIKKRGLPLDPEQLRRRLRPGGSRRATLLVAPLDGNAVALLARRLRPADPG